MADKQYVWVVLHGDVDQGWFVYCVFASYEAARANVESVFIFSNPGWGEAYVTDDYTDWENDSAPVTDRIRIVQQEVWS